MYGCLYRCGIDYLDRHSGLSDRLAILLIMTEPVQWWSAWMGWRPEGYVLRAPLWAQERPLHESRSALKQAIDGALDEFEVVSISVSPMELSSNGGQADSEPGELAIVTSQMISAQAAQALRESVSAVLVEAVEAADRAEEADQAAWELVRQALRDAPA